MKPQEAIFARAPRLDRRDEVLKVLKDRYEAQGSRSELQSRSVVKLPRERLEPTGDRAEDAKALELQEILDFPVPSEARLRALFELTAAEARLAQCLSRGESLEEAALKLSIKMTTARTQLAAVFAKTDTRRQAKLVAILSRIAHLG
jgi:DNA-binding CsgD family transcriptional regulator